MEHRIKNEIYSWLKAIVLGLIIAMIVKVFLFSSYIVKGESMMPTLQDGNHMIINKVNYEFSQPNHGDIIIFHATPTKDYVKRVIGLPGDTIEYKNDQLYRNGKPVAEPYLDQYKKELESGFLTADFTLKALTGKTRVPKGKLWVMGDNRLISSDSRKPWIGFVDQKEVVGKVSFRLKPFTDFK
ncbi:signal peptidase I [Falsibacillus pallidus]|uniref:signal peptidase I n=1 Tax=Falsibacillus pallidus TaxID=493781 RepID=UPI003D96E702